MIDKQDFDRAIIQAQLTLLIELVISGLLVYISIAYENNVTFGIGVSIAVVGILLYIGSVAMLQKRYKKYNLR